MLKIPGQEHTAEFRMQAVTRVTDGQNIRDLARELVISHEAPRTWMKAHDVGTTLNGPTTQVITPEQMELSRLRAENKRLMMELGRWIRP
jgi:transposase